MKITDKRTKEVRFSELKIGTVFVYNFDYYIKATSVTGGNYAVNLRNGKTCYLSDETITIPVNAELVIREYES